MAKLLMITGRGSASDLASGKRGAFYSMLEEFHRYWERIDIIAPKVKNPVSNIFGNVYIHSSPLPLLFHPIFFIRKALEIYEKEKFDLITVHEFPPFYNGIGARMLWNKIRVPYVLEIFHIVGYPKAADLKEKIYRRFFYFFIKHDCKKAKAVRVMNNQVAQKLIVLGVPESKINLIPAIYLDLDIFKPMNLDKKYNLIFIGRLVKNKGINLLIEAASKFKIAYSAEAASAAKAGQNSNFKLLIIGEGLLKKNLESRIRNYGLKEDIILYGWASDSQEIAKLLNQSRILIMPSYNEGGPRVVLEAMACGVPVLATPVGIVPDIIKDGESGEIIKWDSNDIAGRIKNLLDNCTKYEEYRRTGMEVAKEFEKKVMIKNYAEKLSSFI